MLKKLLCCCLLIFFLISQIDAQVGIGTTSPDASAALDVTGTTKGLLIPRVNLVSVSQAAPIVAPATGLLVFSSTAPTGGNGIGYYYWSGAGGTPANNWVSLITSSSAANLWSITGNGGTSEATNFLGTSDAVGLYLRTNNQERMRITSAGKVGIGVAGDPTDGLQISTGNLANRANLNLISPAGNTNFQLFAQDGGDVELSSQTAANFYAGTDNNAPVRVRTNGVNDRVYVGGDGNIGIGTNVPSTKLDVNGQFRIRDLPVGNLNTDVTITADANGNLRQVLAGKTSSLVIGATATDNTVVGSSGGSYRLTGDVVVNTIPGATYNTATSVVSLPTGTYSVTLAIEATLSAIASGPAVGINSYFYDFPNGASGSQRLHANSPATTGGVGVHGVCLQFTIVIPSSRTCVFQVGWGQGGNIPLGTGISFSRGCQLSFIKLE